MITELVIAVLASGYVLAAMILSALAGVIVTVLLVLLFQVHVRCE